MQSVRYIEIVQEAHVKLRVAEFVACLEPMFDRSPNIGTGAIMTQFNDLMFEARDNLAFLNENPDKRSVIESLGLAEAFSPRFLPRLMLVFQNRPSKQEFRNAPADYTEIYSFYSTMKSVQRLYQSLTDLIAVPRGVKTSPNQSAIDFEMLEIGERGFDLERVEVSLKLLDNLFRQLCIVYGAEEKPPRIAYLDSGSGLIISLKGPEKIIKALQNLVISVWNSIRFRKYEDIDKKLDTIDSSLEIMQKLKDCRESGAITEEASQRITHLITKDIFGLFENGTTLREIQVAEVIENQKLLKDIAEVKALPSSSQNQQKDNPASPQ